jgi:hypothetical protein
MTTGHRETGAPACGSPRPWREESRRTDLVQVGRFAYERALRRPELGLSAGAHHVASVLASYCDARGRDIFPSQQTLAAVCRRSVRHIRAKLRELTELGLVRRLTHGGGRPSWRDGRRRRVTPARYELTLPGWLVDRDGGDAPGRARQPDPTGKSGTATDLSQSADADGALPDRLAAAVVEQIRAALGVTAVTEEYARAALVAAVGRAPGQVANPVAYGLRVIASAPAAFRPTPNVAEPACPRHPDHPASRCPDCAAARSGPSEEWRRMRDRLRRGHDP